MKPEDWPRAEQLIDELLALDEERIAVARTCAGDMDLGVQLTVPIMAAHKRVVKELRELMDRQ